MGIEAIGIGKRVNLIWNVNGEKKIVIAVRNSRTARSKPQSSTQNRQKRNTTEPELNSHSNSNDDDHEQKKLWLKQIFMNYYVYADVYFCI